jgi:two-component sensor histidine kinase
VTPPGQRGFGMTLIERSLPHDLNGSAEVEFAAEGVRASLRAALPRMSTAIPGVGGPSQARLPAGSAP